MHLRKGSLQPPKLEGKLRLYSMKYCTYARRVHLVLLAKNIPHDIINVHLRDKPEWLTNLNPLGQVPILDIGSKIITDSINICDYLDSAYPDPPLYPKNEENINRDKKLMKDFGIIEKEFLEMCMMPNKRSYKEFLEIVLPLIEKYEIELQTRGSTFFGGNSPHIIDYVLWPFAEKASLCETLYKEKLPDEKQFPGLYSWCAAMRMQLPVRHTKINLECLKIIYEKIRNNDEVDYDLE